MFLGYVGAIVGGIALAATLLALSKLFRINLPRWIYPAAGGIGMIALTITVEYSWFKEVTSNLPEEIEVVETFDYSVTYQPWTYLVPRINRFIAVDHTSARLNPNAENVVLVDAILMERMSPSIIASQFIDCTTGQRHLMDDTVALGEDGLPVDPDWVDMGLDNPLIAAVCRRHIGMDSEIGADAEAEG